MVTVVALRAAVHGEPVSAYVAELRERLPDHEVRHARTPSEEREYVAEASVATGLYFDESLLADADLELFVGAYAGYDHLPMAALREHGVVVTTASGIHAPNVAEHAVGAILAFSRRFPEAWRRQHRGEWRHYQVGELAGSTATVVGLGAIGTGVVERLRAFDVETLGVRRNPGAGGPADEVVGPDGLHDALARTDHLVLACPLTEATRGLVGTAELRTLPPDAVLVNVARGAVVDTDALVAALRDNDLRGAALDVTDPEPLPADHPLLALDNVLVTPHNAGHTPRYYERLAEVAAENVRRHVAGEPLRNRVDEAGSESA